LTNFGEDEFFRLLRTSLGDRGSRGLVLARAALIWTLPRDEVIRVLRHQISWARTYSE
jgi:hypothetical protein